MCVGGKRKEPPRETISSATLESPTSAQGVRGGAAATLAAGTSVQQSSAVYYARGQASFPWYSLAFKHNSYSYHTILFVLQVHRYLRSPLSHTLI